MDMYSKIQSLVFPKESIHVMCKDLFYYGASGFVDRENDSFVLGVGQSIDLATYLNGCVWAKWKKYTYAKKCKLRIKVEGQVQLLMVGYHLEHRELMRKEFDVIKDLNEECRYIEYTFPDNEEVILGVEVFAIGNCRLYGGEYYAECEEKHIRDVNLAIATTTCKKEKYIKHNVELIRNEILQGDDDIKDHLELHVVDNGRTLKKEEIECEHIHLHPNSNTGGAGGFSRGMIESLHQDPKATHVLLMDDDVVVLTESIKRTYHMLRLLRDEYSEHFINGAMLKMEVPNVQIEDTGSIMGVDVCPCKPGFEMWRRIDVVRNDGCYYNAKNQYGAWWFCCIPIEIIKKNGFALPIFIRLDDADYSLRCKAKFITMSGICVWHMGFEYKYNYSMDVYQNIRNRLILQAVHPGLSDIDFYSHALHLYHFAMIKFEYGSMRVIIRALEDYLKGPSFLEKADGEKILMNNNKENEKFVPLEKYPDVYIRDINAFWGDDPWNKKDDRWLNITDNGQKRGRFHYKNTPMPLAPMGFAIQWAKVARRKEYGALNPFDETVAIRKKDKKTYRQLMARYKNVVKEYEKKHKSVEKQYRDAYSYLTSEEFWKKYLGI